MKLIKSTEKLAHHFLLRPQGWKLMQTERTIQGRRRQRKKNRRKKKEKTKLPISAKYQNKRNTIPTEAWNFREEGLSYCNPIKVQTPRGSRKQAPALLFCPFYREHFLWNGKKCLLHSRLVFRVSLSSLPSYHLGCFADLVFQKRRGEKQRIWVSKSIISWKAFLNNYP